MPKPGTEEYERMVSFMREDLRTGMGLTKIIEQARKQIEDSGKDFDEEFNKWLEKRERRYT